MKKKFQKINLKKKKISNLKKILMNKTKNLKKNLFKNIFQKWKRVKKYLMRQKHLKTSRSNKRKSLKIEINN